MSAGMTDNVWLYWDDAPGTTRPAYLDLCLSTISRQRGPLTVRVVTADTIASFVDVHPRFGDLSLNHRSDVARCALVLEHGGLWLDIDTVAIRPLVELVELADGHDFVGYGADGMHPGTFVAPAGSAVLADWSSQQHRLLDRAGPLSWTEVGPDPLHHAVTGRAWRRIDHRRIAPVDWQDWRTLLSTSFPLRRLLGADPYVIALYNAPMRHHLETLTERQLINSPMLVGRLLALATEQGGPTLGEAVRNVGYPAACAGRAASAAARRAARRLRARQQ